MHALVDETTLLSLNQPPTDAEPRLQQEAQATAGFILHSAQLLGQCWDLGSVQSGAVQGSKFCAVVSYSSTGVADKALLSPEQLSISMALRILEGAGDE